VLGVVGSETQFSFVVVVEGRPEEGPDTPVSEGKPRATEHDKLTAIPAYTFFELFGIA
jgi:hypothetical protein